MTDWFARPVLHVTDVEAPLRFYVNRLGFTSPWRYEEDGRAHVACCGGGGFRPINRAAERPSGSVRDYATKWVALCKPSTFSGAISFFNDDGDRLVDHGAHGRWNPGPVGRR
jgi:hypothetical protein